MREIKFRGMHNGKWVYGSYTHLTDMESGKPYIIPFGTNIFVDVEPESVGAFTGVLDNSTPPKEIYEGDIVKYPEYYFNDSLMPAGAEVIEWEGNGFNELLWFGYGNYPAWVEVIGNIFENPELLEKASNGKD